MQSYTLFSDNNQLISNTIPNINDIKLTSKISNAYNEQADPQQQANIVKDFLFREIWRKEIVNKFKFQEIHQEYFISYNRYEMQSSSYLEMLNELIDDINSTQKNNIAPLLKIRSEQTIFQMANTAVKEINNATLIICFRQKRDALDKYFHSENNAIKKNSSANIVPIAIDDNVQECIPVSLQNSNSLVYRKKDYGLAYSTLFAELLSKMGILNEASKSFFDKASLQLRKQIDIELKDEDIQAIIRAYEKEGEEELKLILGLT